MDTPHIRLDQILLIFMQFSGGNGQMIGCVNRGSATGNITADILGVASKKHLVNSLARLLSMKGRDPVSQSYF